MTEVIVAITGANSGLGLALLKELMSIGIQVIPINGPDHGPGGYDLTDADHVFAASETIKEQTDDYCKRMSIDREEVYPILVNCAGINYIEWFDKASWESYDKLMDLNLKAPLMLVQSLLEDFPFTGHPEWFKGTGAVVNIISNASHVPMTNSVFYNASKGALHIATLAMARELRKTHGICVFGVSPNKMSGTQMSSYIEERVPGLRGWTPEQAAAYQLSALPAGEETPPEAIAQFLGFLLCKPENHKYLTNTVIPYGC